jgi:tRNA-specific 2-thiouridylase
MIKCLVGVSGGVDSLFAAVILKSQGFDVSALHLYLHSKESMDKNAEDILKKHGIELEYADYTEAFKRYVVEYFTEEYSRGFTPNPCIICNRDVKLPMLYREAKIRKIGLIATGHYADTDEDGNIKRHKSKKDQSYFLACVDSEILKHTLFPLKDYKKEDAIKYFNLTNTSESSDLCFVNNNYSEILMDKLGVRKGKIVKEKQIVGYHDGFYNYTIGQRKGIKVGNKPHYVVGIDAKHNIVYAGEEDKLYKDRFYLDGLNLFKDEEFFDGVVLECMVRYKTQPKKCILNVKKRRVELLEKERAITPGQIAVFYIKGTVVACGKIGYGIY